MKFRLRYHIRLFLTAALCIWAVVFCFAYMVILQESRSRNESMAERLDIATSCIADACESDNDIPTTINFVKRYLKDTYLQDVKIQVYDLRNHQVMYSVGGSDFTVPEEALNAERVTKPDGTKMLTLLNSETADPDLFLYSSCLTPDEALDIRLSLPCGKKVLQAASVNPIIWVFMIAIGVVGTLLAYYITSHQARNVTLLHDFAHRAAGDKDFIPIGNFPSDEIGEISRQIVAIYNSRMQANVRREREHVIALKSIQDKNNMKKILTDNISHELKTPIGIIRAYVDMLIEQPDMPDTDRQHFLQKTKQSVDRLVNMLNDLSTMTRLDESGSTISMREVDFHSLIFSLADDVTKSGILKDMDFRFNIPIDCKVMGNEDLLISVIQNLIKNACAYSQGTQMGVELLGRNDRYYTFSFFDNGVGVSKEHMEHLFERFYRVDSGRSRKAGGTGLGLPIVKSCINTMGGSVSVRNRRGGGLEFIFTLLRSRQEPQA